jgi:tellurite resistance protein TerC
MIAAVFHPELFPMARVWWLYGLFCLLILASLYLDLRGKEGKEHVIGHREAIHGVVFWIGLALLFCGGLYCFGLWEFPLDPSLAGYDPKALAKQCSLEFLSGYLIEKSLSIDNLFIFLVVFDFFVIPEKYRHRVLFYGILGAIVFRALFIALGSMLMQISWVPLIFGVFLAFTGLKVAFGPESHPDPSKNVLIRLLKRFLPISPVFHDQRFFVCEGGRWLGTPLLLALLFLEFTDIVFAVDSVPAIFAITKEPFLVFTSNIFAILGLRSLFFLLAGMASKFHYLKYGLGFILCFVGLKMSWLDSHFGGHFPTSWSLGIILAALLLSALFSALFPRKSPDSD